MATKSELVSELVDSLGSGVPKQFKPKAPRKANKTRSSLKVQRNDKPLKMKKPTLEQRIAKELGKVMMSNKKVKDAIISIPNSLITQYENKAPIQIKQKISLPKSVRTTLQQELEDDFNVDRKLLNKLSDEQLKTLSDKVINVKPINPNVAKKLFEDDIKTPPPKKTERNSSMPALEPASPKLSLPVSVRKTIIDGILELRLGFKQQMLNKLNDDKLLEISRKYLEKPASSGSGMDLEDTVKTLVKAPAKIKKYR